MFPKPENRVASFDLFRSGPVESLQIAVDQLCQSRLNFVFAVTKIANCGYCPALSRCQNDAIGSHSLLFSDETHPNLWKIRHFRANMKNLSILTLFIGLLATFALRFAAAQQDADEPSQDAAATTDQPAEDKITEHNEEALAIVRKARSELFKHQSVQAVLTQRASLGEFRFTASGKYAAGEGFRTRIEYNVELAEMAGQFLEVCDGQILHTRRQVGPKDASATNSIPPQIELARRDIQVILKETQEYLELEELQANKAMLAAEIGIGGLPAILASLERMYLFEAMKTDQENGQDVVIVQGLWNEARQEEIVQVLGPMVQQVGRFFPDRVRITFLSDSSFPIRFQYLKLADAENKIYRPMLTLELSDVRINEPLSPQLFNYVRPVGLEERDETAIFIESIRSAVEPETGSQPTETPTNPQ